MEALAASANHLRLVQLRLNFGLARFGDHTAHGSGGRGHIGCLEFTWPGTAGRTDPGSLHMCILYLTL